MRSFYPVVCTDRLEQTERFYRDWFGFEETFRADWYVSLRGPRGHELAVLDRTHPSLPEGYRLPVQGLLLNVEVDDVDSEWRRLVLEGRLEPVLAIRSEAFGQRHFIVRDPSGVLVDVITEIPPTEEYAVAFDTTAPALAVPPVPVSRDGGPGR